MYTVHHALKTGNSGSSITGVIQRSRESDSSLITINCPVQVFIADHTRRQLACDP